MATTTSKPDFSKQMGELLLQGWTMKADTCPTCMVPIMCKSNKFSSSTSSGPEEICVGCGTDYKKEKKGGAANQDDDEEADGDDSYE